MLRTRYEIRGVVVGLVIINTAIFLFSQVPITAAQQWFIKSFTAKGEARLAYAVQQYGIFTTLFSLFPTMIREHGWLWQFFTYMFLHGSIIHLIFNMYALFLFGMPLEERWGSRKFFFFYTLTGMGAGVVTFVWNLFQNPFIPTIGASGAVFGVMLAFGLEFPDTVLLLFFILPIRARYAVFIYGGIELVMLVTGAAQRIGHFTHLAGLFFGYIYYIVGIKRRLKTRAFSKSRRRVVKEKKETINPRVRREIEQVIELKEKLREGRPLSRAETVFMLKLKKSHGEASGRICGAEDFDLTAWECARCEDFYACLYRFLIGQL